LTGTSSLSRWRLKVRIWRTSSLVPNVRGLGEMDDRLELDEVEVEIHADGRAHALRFLRTGPLWLGLVCGLQLEIPFVDEGA
jgi:hypothetical protein